MGMGERVNRNFTSKLRKLANFKHNKWKGNVSNTTKGPNLSYYRALALPLSFGDTRGYLNLKLINIQVDVEFL